MVRRLGALLAGLARPEALALIVLGAAATRAFSYTVDDAYIVVRYAQRLTHGAGYTFSAGSATDGVTSPLWLAVGATGAGFGVPVLLTLKLVGLVATLAAVWRLVRSTRQRTLGAAEGWFCALLCASSAPLALWAVAGLETGLATLVATLLALEAQARRPRNLLGGCLCAFSVPWLRPELVPYAAVALLGCGGPRRRVRLWLSAGAGLGSVVGFRALVFGHLAPMTAAAKPALLGHGVQYVLASVRPLPALCLGLCALLAAWLPRQRLLVAALLVHGLAVMLAGGDWMPAARLFVPVIPCAAWLASSLLARAHARLRKRRVWLLLAVAAVLLLRGASLAHEVASARAAGMTRLERVPALAALIPAGPGPLVALDVGLLGVLSPGSIVDLGGLTEPRIAYAPGAHLDKRVDSAWLEARHPRAVVLHSEAEPRVDAQGRLRWFAGYPVERRVLAMPWVRDGFRVAATLRYHDAYYYVVLTPRADGSGLGAGVKSQAP